MGHFVLPLIAISAMVQPAVDDPLLIVPDAAMLRFDDLGLYRVGVAFRGRPDREFPRGWQGPFDDATGLACQPVGKQNGREAWLLHCPWRNGTGVAFQEFHLQLPRARRILLRGATALRADGVGKSDGVTFRISAGRQKLLEIHRADAAWRDFEFDLTPQAGNPLVIRFETDPGPKDDASFDFALWGDRRLVLDGFQPAARLLPAPAAQSPASLVSRPAQGIVPPIGFRHKNRWERQGNAFVLRYEGGDGVLEYHWEPPARAQRQENSIGLFGEIALRASLKGSAEVRVPLAAGAQLVWSKPARGVGNHWEETPDGPVLIRSFQVADRTAVIRIKGSLIGKSLVLDLEADQPLAALLDSGNWGPTVRRRTIPVPYFSGRVDYLPAEGLFVAANYDWTVSAATSLDGSRASYLVLTDGRRNPIRERIVFSAAWHLDEVLPNIPNRPSPFLGDLADRIVLDIWGGRYTEIAHHFEILSGYGINRCVAIVHDWQRSGYDNALPMHLPAASDKGGDPGMKTLVATAKRLGYVVALHENYVDYYPNYDHFREADIALDSAGKRQNAWYNPGTKIQSFAVAPTAILALAATQSAEIHRRYGTNACYLDVHSAVPPWFHVDERASARGAGSFRTVWEIHRQLWDYERTTHHGPVFGEGNNHWYWSGCLDGVEAQFGAGWPGEAGREAPLLVDFDLLKIHPLQLNHGMGYYERWWSKSAWGTIPPMVVLDQYRMQEIAFGHAGFLGAATWPVVPLAWLEHHLLTPVTARSAKATPVEILYELKGKWVDATTAARSESDPSAWQRVRVRYNNGMTITANQLDRPLAVGASVLDRFGWLAEGAGVTAWTARRDGVIADYAETADRVFANARPASDWDFSAIKRIRPVVAHFESAGRREIRFTYNWQVNDVLPHRYTCFVHFGKVGAPESAILFQQDHALAVPTSQWRPGRTIKDGPHTLTIPAGLPDGDYAWTIGLFTPSEGRLSLEGVSDGTGRIRLGSLRIKGSGREIAFIPERDTGGRQSAIYQEHLNPRAKLVDFGPVRTNGSVLIERAGSQWVARTFPRDRAFTLLLSTSRFGRPSEVQCVGGRSRVVVPAAEGALWRLPVSGASEYRWDTR
ncbi:MAG: DUF5696 domain-containing protein [Isosphaeraceae bacterium]